MTFFTNMFRTPTLGFLLGDVPLILYNSGIILEMSAMKVFMWNRMRKLGLQKSQRSFSSRSALLSTLLLNYLQNFMYIGGSRVS